MNRSDSIRRDRSFDSVLNKFMRMRSQNNESFRAAMYNFLIAAGVCALVAVCFILGPFVRPLLWAFLMGAVLFPFKKKLADLLNGWFERLEAQDSNVFVSICLGPMEATEYCGRLLVDWFREHWQLITAGFGIAASVKLLIAYAPKGFLCAVWKLIVFSHTTFVDLISYLNIYLLIVIVSIYLTSVYFLWKPELSSRFAIFGQLLWVAIVTYACSFLGAFQVPVLIVIMIYVIVSIGYHLQMNEDSSTLVQKLKKLLNKNDFEKSMATITEKKQSLHSDIEDISLSETMDSVETIEHSIVNNEPNLSDNYFKILFYACITTFLYRNAWMCILAAIPISLHLLNTLGDITGLKGFMYSKISDFYNIIKSWTIEHHSAILPLCLPGILELNYKINGIVRNSLKSSVDLVTSVLMIILMLLIIVFLSVFFCVNIYSETIEVAYMGKDLINKTITNRPELVDILPANIQSSLDDALDNAHHYGRRKIEAYINDWLAEADPIHATKLRDQILDVWDRLIQYWIDFNKSDTSYGPRVPTEALKSTFGEIVDNPGHFKELVLVAKQGIIGWAQSNTQTILEVAESLWHIIRTNLSMIMSFTGDILSLLLSGGQACIEFILDMIVFFTALFYLLASSNVQYAPLQITKYLGFSSSGTKIADALDNSISGVLMSLFKCSIFTCLFTWFMHTICGARIVFLPAALAAVLSAAPFLGSYWCSVPAFLELWLAQDRFYAGIFLFLMQFFVPPYFEAAIYSEMKGGGHPYLTGLAIAGGMYWFGWQGAIFGPLMLCFFIGMVEIAAVAMRSNDDTRRSSDEDTRTTNTEVVDVIADLVSSSMDVTMGTPENVKVEATSNRVSQDHNANQLPNSYTEHMNIANKFDLSTEPKTSIEKVELSNKLLPNYNKQKSVLSELGVTPEPKTTAEKVPFVNKLLLNCNREKNILDEVDVPTPAVQTNIEKSTVLPERVELKIISKILVPQSDNMNY